MLVSFFQSGAWDLGAFFLELLLLLPGLLFALSGHEAAHAWIAYRCGDPTAKAYGRLTLNPIKHIDIRGFALLLLVGFGWAKPVPVNPSHFRRPRRDDFAVSIAGICANALMFLTGLLFMYGLFAAALHQAGTLTQESGRFARRVAGESVVFSREADGVFYYSVRELCHNAPWMADFLITPVLGSVAGYIYQILMYFVSFNLSLALFNLLPIPPLDGYHILNDLILRKSLFAPQKVTQIFTAILFGLIMMGNINEELDLLGKAISWVQQGVYRGIGEGAYAILGALGIA